MSDDAAARFKHATQHVSTRRAPPQDIKVCSSLGANNGGLIASNAFGPLSWGPLVSATFPSCGSSSFSQDDSTDSSTLAPPSWPSSDAYTLSCSRSSSIPYTETTAHLHMQYDAGQPSFPAAPAMPASPLEALLCAMNTLSDGGPSYELSPVGLPVACLWPAPAKPARQTSTPGSSPMAPSTPPPPPCPTPLDALLHALTTLSDKQAAEASVEPAAPDRMYEYCSRSHAYPAKYKAPNPSPVSTTTLTAEQRAAVSQAIRSSSGSGTPPLPSPSHSLPLPNRFRSGSCRSYPRGILKKPTIRSAPNSYSGMLITEPLGSCGLASAGSDVSSYFGSYSLAGLPSSSSCGSSMYLRRRSSSGRRVVFLLDEEAERRHAADGLSTNDSLSLLYGNALPEFEYHMGHDSSQAGVHAYAQAPPHPLGCSAPPLRAAPLGQELCKSRKAVWPRACQGTPDVQEQGLYHPAGAAPVPATAAAAIAGAAAASSKQACEFAKYGVMEGKDVDAAIIINDELGEEYSTAGCQPHAEPCCHIDAMHALQRLSPISQDTVLPPSGPDAATFGSSSSSNSWSSTFRQALQGYSSYKFLQPLLARWNSKRSNSGA